MHKRTISFGSLINKTKDKGILKNFFKKKKKMTLLLRDVKEGQCYKECSDSKVAYMSATTILLT